ncbi:GGDEF domain-containing protein [Nocardioides sp. LML1-1-1.1]|uniref:GGDEF domain-containing protein n=1 Tax=Nocardioides sp. LML1-1-1.1 TaxID=3135248 RepID=UPI00342A3405
MAGLDVLLRAVQELSLAPRLTDVQRVVTAAARELAGCDGVTFVLRDGEQCYYADEDAIAPLWRGKRFPVEACVSGWAMQHREHAVIPDIYDDPRVPHEAYRDTFVKSMVMTPIRTMAPIGAVGAYWARLHEPAEEEIALLRALADATSLALEKVSIHRELEQEVRLAKDAHRLAQTDDLTGTLNRRGFGEHVAEAMPREQSSDAAVAFIDINGLKAVNDREGHVAGDRLIQDVARILQMAVRPGDVVGRVGGDEFAVFALDLDPATLRARLEVALSGRASVGTAALHSPDELYDALLAADVQMYAAKASLTRTPSV